MKHEYRHPYPRIEWIRLYEIKVSFQTIKEDIKASEGRYQNTQDTLLATLKADSESLKADIKDLKDSNTVMQAQLAEVIKLLQQQHNKRAAEWSSGDQEPLNHPVSHTESLSAGQVDPRDRELLSQLRTTALQTTPSTYPASGDENEMGQAAAIPTKHGEEPRQMHDPEIPMHCNMQQSSTVNAGDTTEDLLFKPQEGPIFSVM